MIVPMKKITVIFSISESDLALEALREYGDFHPSALPLRFQEKGWLLFADKKIALFYEALSIVSRYHAENYPNSRKMTVPDEDNDLSKATEKIIYIRNKIIEIRKEISELEKDLKEAEPWGNSDSEVILRLSADLMKKGFTLRFFRLKVKDLGKIPEDEAFFEVFRNKSEVVAGVISGGKDSLEIFPEAYPPRISHSKIKRVIEKNRNEIASLEAELKNLAKHNKKIRHEIDLLESSIEFEKVRTGIDDRGGIGVLQGFCPQNGIEKLKMLAKKEKWAILIEAPSPDDQVPTLIKDSWFSRLFRPVMDFMGLRPSYFEPDTNFAFLLFLTFFFALLVGDAGYGLVMLSGAFILRLIKKDIKKEIIMLFYILSLSSMIWGSVTGMWFGSEKMAGLWPFRSLIVPELYGFSEESDSLVIEICLIIALCQLSIAHFWKGIRSFPGLRVLSEAGWIAILFGIYKIAGSLLLGEKSASGAFVLIISGAAVIIIFGNTDKVGIIENMKSSLSDLPANLLGGIGCFSDSISYIRLFAVGIATREMAVAFNKLALNIGFETFFYAFLALIVLLSGHAVNILLACMSVLVHGLRLNILEFSSHLNMEWTGIPYRPFRKNGQ